MKRILGLDLGIASIGWALVNEAEQENETSSIVKLGVRVNPLTSDEQTDFEKGNPLSLNADRTLKRQARRNLQRYKQRRDSLIRIFIENGFINEETVLNENGKNKTFETLRLRALSASGQVSKEELVRILLAINKKRGYKSSRKANNEEEGSLIDGMSIARAMYENNLTPGQFVLQSLKNGKKFVPDFYRSDLRDEFDKIWNFQKQFYPDILTDDFYKKLDGQGMRNSTSLFKSVYGIYTAENRGKREEVKLQKYQWRSNAILLELPIEVVAYVLVEINNDLNKSSGYLGAISDRSKELFFNKESVGQNLYRQIKENPHTSLKNQVFYRQDYLDEFEQIWETQSVFYPEMTKELKEDVRDHVIFYQRRLKSQKHLISHCEFEPYHKVIPKSSPLFQEFKIWQVLNNLAAKRVGSNEIYEFDLETKEYLFQQLNLKGKHTPDEILKLLNLSKKEWKLNYANAIEGNSTNAAYLEVFHKIAENEGYGFDWDKKSATQIKDELYAVFQSCGISNEILSFNSDIEGDDFEKQIAYRFWHLLYSAEDDVKTDSDDQLIYGNNSVSLKKNLHKKYGFKPEYAALVAGISFSKDYGNLSSRAIRKILLFLKEGHEFSEACKLAGYNHSHSLKKEELQSRELKPHLDLLKKNSLRNPVVEKILNQMVNLVNQVIDTYGKPDEVRIELARELKKSAEERKKMTQHITQATRKHEEIKLRLQTEFGIKHPTRNDIVRYKLYEELRENGYKTVYSNKYIPKEKLFSKEIDIEHIIPKSRLFDDSFSNKTLEYRSVNLDKGELTAMDFMEQAYASQVEVYKQRVEMLHKAWFSSGGETGISKGKAKKLLMSIKDIPEDFIERDLRNSQYIAKKAKQMLFEVFRTVSATSGSITDELREDWGLINVMKEMNLPKYRALGLTQKIVRKDGREVEQIIDWTKRNDHRHHAMDALTVAFTTSSHVQYLNNLNTAKDKNSKLYGIKQKITEVIKTDDGNSRVFIAPMPNFREEAKKHLEGILISYKAKNKVFTRNINTIKQKNGEKKVMQLTPRGQLHEQTIYGKMNKEVVEEVKLGTKITHEVASKVTKQKYKEALLYRLAQNENNPKKAFSGKNAPAKQPVVLLDGSGDTVPEKVKVKSYEDYFTIRKEIAPDLKLDKIVDDGVRNALLQHLEKHNGDPKKAFSDLDKNPVWLNEKAGISIKRVTIHGVNNAIALHDKRDQFGNPILDENGKPQPADFVSTGNNHHVAIYRDENGKFQDQVVSFFEAMVRVNSGLPVVNKEYRKDDGWEFLFSMKQNECFVFPAKNFNPHELDLFNKNNRSIISENLYYVQSLSVLNYGNSTIRDFIFRYHLDSMKLKRKELKEFMYFHIKSLSDKRLMECIKVRLNHLGDIVQIGEY